MLVSAGQNLVRCRDIGYSAHRCTVLLRWRTRILYARRQNSRQHSGIGQFFMSSSIAEASGPLRASTRRECSSWKNHWQLLIYRYARSLTHARLLITSTSVNPTRRSRDLARCVEAESGHGESGWALGSILICYRDLCFQPNDG